MIEARAFAILDLVRVRAFEMTCNRAANGTTAAPIVHMSGESVQKRAQLGREMTHFATCARHKTCTFPNDFDKYSGHVSGFDPPESEAKMGGYSSTRWNFERTRRETDPLLYLDVRWLKRMGALRPGAWFFPHWTSRGEPSGDITTHAGHDGESLLLSYRVRSPGEDWQPIEVTVCLETTPCHYGGERTWFLCPGCESRCAVLYSAGGRFRCRKCHDLAYSSTREGAQDRALRRIRIIQKRLGGGGYGVPIWDIPLKPPRLHWRTYDRLVRELRIALYSRDMFMDQWLAKREALLERLTKGS